MITAGTSTEKPIATDVVTVNYTGWRSDGMMFDSTVARGNDFDVPARPRDGRLARVRASS